jgi:predicted transcriptional regulator
MARRSRGCIANPFAKNHEESRRPAILTAMTAKILTDAMQRVETWPEDAQEELAAIALEIDDALSGGVYLATAKELTGIDRGVGAADAGRFAAPDDIAALFAKHRPG